MSKGYLFISNSTKPTDEQYKSLESVGPDSFSTAALWAANKMGWGLHMGINRKCPDLIKSKTYDIKFYNQHIYRNIFAFKDNWKAYKNLCHYLNSHPEIEVIHCNTPIGGVIGRIVGHKYKKKVIYTAHGFHFYMGAPRLNWLLFYPIEKFLARWTDILITINKEDYAVAQRFMNKKEGKAYYVSGVGVDVSRFKTSRNDGNNVRDDLGLDDKDILVVSVGRLDKNKNNITILKAISLTKNTNIHLIICGEGDEKDRLLKLSKDLEISDRIHLLGIRNDIPQIFSHSDIFVLASFREGLSRSIMEAMAAGLPCIVSDIRGNRDLIDVGKGGMLFSPHDANQLANCIDELATNPERMATMGMYNNRKVERFSLEASQNAHKTIFEKELKNDKHVL